MELTVDGSYSMWNSLSKLEEEWNLQGWSAKMPHSLGVLYFGLGGFQGVLHTFMEAHLLWPSTFPEFPRQTWLQWTIQKGISSITMPDFFLEQTTDRKIDLLF